MFVSSDYRLDEITITGSRFGSDSGILTFAISDLDSLLIHQPVQQLSIKEQLLQVPGLFIQNAYNFAQDARISIRGFGANAAFGIRGIKLIVDGIPETTPDGTGQLDNLNLDQIGTIKVIRGASSSLYGNASGGTVLLNSKGLTNDYLSFQSMIGSYGFYSQAVSGGMKNSKASYQANLRYFGNKGFRDHSSFQQYNARFAMKQQISDQLSANFIAEAVHSPKGQDAGGLTLEATEIDFRQARDRNVDFNAGESITQWKIGTSINWKTSDLSNLSTYLFYNQREFDGRLPFENSGSISLKRDYFGLGNHFQTQSGSHRIRVGYDLLSQTDQRKRFNNLAGEQGAMVLDQQETFRNLGIYASDQFQRSGWTISAGIRFDFNELKVNDQFLGDGNDSGSINMNNWSYQLGLARFISSSLKVFANHSTSFETPTLAQLSNRPDNSGGFENLGAANANSFETGLEWNKGPVNIELVGFIIRTTDELVPYELEDFPERTFFQNAGRTSRKGLEFSARYQHNSISIYTTYTLAKFNFKDYEVNGTSLNGFRLPGIPSHHAAFHFIFHPKKTVVISLPIKYTGSMKADNENEVSIEDYVEAHIMAQYQRRIGKILLTPFIGIRNITNQTYFDNVRINAFGGRYFEPAPKRNYYAGLKVSI